MNRIDLSIPDPERKAEGLRSEQLMHQINALMPHDPAVPALLKQLFCQGFGASSKIVPPLYVNLGANVRIGSNVSIQPYFKAMAAGQIVIEDDVKIALNVSLLTNNHDFYRREVLTVEDITIRKGAWIGAGSILLPGVTIGEYAVVGAGSVVTKDVAPYTVAAGNPARTLRVLDEEEFVHD